MNDNTNIPPQPSDRAEAIFDAAVALSAAERVAYLEKACGGDTHLRQQVEGLLQAHDAAGDFLDRPAVPPPKGTIVLTLPPEEKAGDKISHYKILQKIGEGGCGVVYMAEQEHPVRRRVALKIIKLGMDTKQVIARFEAERQALAMMDHPNIAKVLDAGSTENGRPFFVMELVRGIKITDYCDQNKLATRERLGLFVQVCNAIQHAHQKGIIHRDIKPSNILVTLHDGVPVPKVIDFGIAKATQGRLTDHTLFTAFEQFIGTPAYMSPEQAEMSGLDIDTRSDIYALGVLLYELLTGRTPFDAKELLKAGLDELRRTIREKEPERPSTRLSTMLHADLAAIALHRHLDAPKLINLLRGDLDWIVMKSLEKDRTRRYETANGLAMDIQRHLTNEPVVARPPSNLYRFQKLVRRNKTAFAAIATGVAALIVGLAVSVYLFVQERAAHHRAVAAEKEQARLRLEAEENAEWSQKLTRAGLLLTQGQDGRIDKIDEAERLVSDVPPHSTMAAFYNVFGMLHARRFHWQAAVSNYNLVVQFAPNDFPAYHALAPLLVQAGNIEGYQRCREEMLKRFSGTSDPETAERTVKDCSILPPRVGDLEPIGKLADVAIAAGASHRSWGYFEFAKGLAEYRLGHHAAAADWLQKVAVLDGSVHRKVQAYAVLAMAQHERGQIDESRTALTNGIDTLNRRLTKGEWRILDEEWNDWIIAQLLMREAKTLIGDPGVTAEARRVEQQSNELDALRAQAGDKAKKGQWKEATADLRKVLEAEPNDAVWYDLAVVLLQSGDMVGYEKHCQSLLTRLGTTTEPGIARKVAKACLLRPTSGTNLSEAIRLTEVALPQESEWKENVKALAEYRQGNFGNAIDWAKRSLAKPPLDRRDAQTWLVMAMAYHELKQPAEARDVLAKGVEILDGKLPRLDSGDLGNSWVDCVIGGIFRREAEALIGRPR